MSGFKQHLELAQSFQNEMAGFGWVSVSVCVYGAATCRNNLGCRFVSLSVTCFKDRKAEHYFQLIDYRITAESLAELKKELKRLGYEV